MQVSFLKDLVTLRDPTSRFVDFLSYLHAKDRLVDFINARKTLYPLRILSTTTTLEWAAAKVDNLVRYGHEVIGVQPVRDGDYVAGTSSTSWSTPAAAQRCCGPATSCWPLVCARGCRPGWCPVSGSGAAVICCSVCERLDGAAPSPVRGGGGPGRACRWWPGFLPARPLPDGRGLRCLLPLRPTARLTTARSPTASSTRPPSTDFFDAPPAVKDQLNGYHANTNYSVVDGDLIAELYRRGYREQVLGRTRLRLLNMSRLRGAVVRPTGVEVTIETLNTGRTTTVDADVLVCATGCDPVDATTMLGELGEHCHRDDRGQLSVGRDYRVDTDDELECGIYLQGGTEHSHGSVPRCCPTAPCGPAEILASVVAQHDRSRTRRRPFPPALWRLTPIARPVRARYADRGGQRLHPWLETGRVSRVLPER